MFRCHNFNGGIIVRKATVEDILKSIKSGIGLDVAKNHTDICIWNGTSVETFGFALIDYSKDDCFSEYKMRRDFKQKLSHIVTRKKPEYCR